MPSLEFPSWHIHFLSPDYVLVDRNGRHYSFQEPKRTWRSGTLIQIVHLRTDQSKGYRWGSGQPFIYRCDIPPRWWRD